MSSFVPLLALDGQDGRRNGSRGVDSTIRSDSRGPEGTSRLMTSPYDYGLNVEFHSIFPKSCFLIVGALSSKPVLYVAAHQLSTTEQSYQDETIKLFTRQDKLFFFSSRTRFDTSCGSEKWQSAATI